MRIDFREISLTGTKSVKCAGYCGQRLKRQKKFYQTINPFNKTIDGRVKDFEDIYPEIKDAIKEWKEESEFCNHCTERIIKELGCQK